MVIRELITRLGFDVNQSQIASFDRKIGELRNNLRGVSKNLSAIGSSLIGVGSRLSLFVTVPLIAANVAAIKVAATFEQLDISFTTMLGSAEKAQKLIKDMFEFAAKTPFQIKNIGPTVKQLLAFGVAETDIIPTLKTLGDLAAGLGVPIQRLALNFGQVKAQAKLTGRELRDFAFTGIPLLEELAKQLGVSKAEIQDMVSAGRISFEMVETAFKNMTSEGGRFANLMEKQAKTLGGLFSNLLDNLYLSAGAIGEILVETLELKRFIQFLNTQMSKLVEWLQKLNKRTKVILIFFMTFLTFLGPFLITLGLVIKGIAFLSSAFLLLKSALGLAALSAGIFNFAMLLLPALFLAVVAALALLIEDISVWVRGGRSITGKLLGPWKDWSRDMKSIFNGLSNFLDEFFFAAFTSNFDKVISDLDFFKETLKIFVKDVLDELAKIPGFITISKGLRKGATFLGQAVEGVGKTAEIVGRAFSGATPIPFKERRRIEREFEIAARPQMLQRRSQGGVVSIGDINTEVNVSPGEGGTPQDVADVVEEVISRKIVQTINDNLTP